MTSTQPNVSPEGKYSVKETCQALEISAKTLYRHSDSKFIKHGIRRANGRRFYSGSEIIRYWKAQI